MTPLTFYDTIHVDKLCGSSVVSSHLKNMLIVLVNYKNNKITPTFNANKKQPI